MNRNPRNQSLLASLSEHNPFKAELAHRYFKIGNDLERDIAAISDDGRRSQRAKIEDARARAEKAMLEHAEASKLIAAYRKETETLRSGMKKPTFDKTDLAGAIDRWKLCDRSERMSFGQRAALMSGPTRDPDFTVAVTSKPAWVSGFNMSDPNDATLYTEAKLLVERELNPELTVTLEARKGVDSEISMIANVTLTDITSAAADLAASASRAA